jgi:hypothetical protein
MHSKTLPTLNKVIIKCTVHCIVHLQRTFSLSISRIYETKGFWCFSVGMGTKDDKSSTGCVWAAGFHHVTAPSRLAHVMKHMNRLVLELSSKPQIQGHNCTKIFSTFWKGSLFLSTDRLITLHSSTNVSRYSNKNMSKTKQNILQRRVLHGKHNT